MNMIATHPHLTKEILELDGKVKDEGLAQPLSEEEIEDYVPLSALEISSVVDDLAAFGISMN